MGLCVSLSLSLQAVLGAKSEIQRLQSELREVKENGAEGQRSQEANHHSMSEWQQMEQELDDLRHAHQQTLAQNASLKDQLSVMQEFEPECPAPPAPGSTPADCESQRIEKTTFSDSILSPPSSDSHTSMSGEVPSTSLPLLPAKFIQGLSSSTPDMLCGMGMRHDAKSSAVPEQSSMALGQGSMVSGQSEMELEVSVLKQLVEQLEREKENLLLGNREMSQQLTRIDASKMESASALHQILSENSLLQRELQEMREKDDTGRHAREEVQSLLRAKASLSSEVASLRQALQQSSSAAALNGSLQQEVARLTEENLVGVGEEGGEGGGRERVASRDVLLLSVPVPYCRVCWRQWSHFRRKRWLYGPPCRHGDGPTLVEQVSPPLGYEGTSTSLPFLPPSPSLHLSPSLPFP